MQRKGCIKMSSWIFPSTWT